MTVDGTPRAAAARRYAELTEFLARRRMRLPEREPRRDGERERRRGDGDDGDGFPR